MDDIMVNTSSSYDGNYSYTFDVDSHSCTPLVYNLNGDAIAASYTFVFFLSLLGNGVVIFVVHQMENSRTSTDIYLMHLAGADLVFSLTLPFWAVYVHLRYWVFGTYLCKLLSAVQEATFYGCVFLLACISIDRYLAIVKATQFISKQRRTVQVVCALIWLGVCVLALPVAIQREALYLEEYDGYICYENVTESMDEWRVGLRIVRHTVGFFFPLVVMMFCYGWTAGTLLRSRNQKKHKAMRVILCVVLAFVICWLPHNITEFVETLMRGQLIAESCQSQEILDVAQHVTQVVAYTHCAVNPILYAFIGKKFRNHLLLSLVKKGLVKRDCLRKFRLGSLHSSGGSSRLTSVTL